MEWALDQELGPAEQARTDCQTINKIIKENKAALGQVEAEQAQSQKFRELEAQAVEANSNFRIYIKARLSEL